MIINSVTTPKKIPISRQVITFLSIVASRIESPMIAIIKAIAVLSGMPFATKTFMIGTMPAALAYIGTAIAILLACLLLVTITNINLICKGFDDIFSYFSTKTFFPSRKCMNFLLSSRRNFWIMKMREYWNNFCAEPKKCPAVLVAPLFFMNMNIFL